MTPYEQIDQSLDRILAHLDRMLLIIDVYIGLCIVAAIVCGGLLFHLGKLRGSITEQVSPPQRR